MPTVTSSSPAIPPNITPVKRQPRNRHEGAGGVRTTTMTRKHLFTGAGGSTEGRCTAYSCASTTNLSKPCEGCSCLLLGARDCSVQAGLLTRMPRADRKERLLQQRQKIQSRDAKNINTHVTWDVNNNQQVPRDINIQTSHTA